jgi:hypothetical protein
MSVRVAAWLAWPVWMLCVALLALTALLDYYYTPPLANLGNGNVYVFFAVPLVVYVSVGAFVASRRPSNLVGWMLCAIGFLLAVLGLGTAYADYALLADPAFSLPGGLYVACISQTLVMVPALILSATLLILLFPDGRLPDRSLRSVPWLVVGGSAANALWAVSAERGFERYSMPNPLWIGGTLGYAVEVLGRLGAATILVSMIVAVISVFARLRSAQGAKRQQLTWFAYAAAVLLGIFLLFPLSWFLPGWLSLPMGVAVLSAIPVAVGIAVLRYKLYDIDHIINRTLVYGSLTALLILVYFGAVTVTQAVFQSLTGHAELPQFAIVASTLVIAALFTPLRRHIQSFIDRRFYRRKYDTRKTLEEFSAKLRDETDLEALNADLVGVVRETMQPAHASLWLRPEMESKDR